MKKNLRSGYTTGVCAAAGVKAALIFMTMNKIVESVEITALDGTILTIPINNVECRMQNVELITVEVIKFSGDDPDITNGASVFTTIKKIDGKEIIFKGGVGIGKITRAGLAVPIGEPAINPGPRQLIKNVIKEFFNEPIGFEIEISIPAGVKLAKKTLNPILGIEGGISIIGTTGVLRPMSEEAFKKSLVPQIDVALAAGFKTLIFVPGKIGEVAAINFGISKQAIIQTSNFVGYMLEAANDRNVKKIIFFGHIGKLAKIAAGVFYTHNRIADGRLETIAAYSAAEGLDSEGVKKILNANTTDEATKIISAANLESVYQKIAERVSIRAKRYIFNEIEIGAVLVNREGKILGMDNIASEFLKSCQKEG